MDSKIAILFVLIGSIITLSHIGEGLNLGRMRRHLVRTRLRWAGRHRL